MKLGMPVGVLFLAALPLLAGPVFTVDPTHVMSTPGGPYGPGLTLIISTTGTVNLNGSIGFFTNPDGSLSSVPSISCDACWSPGYQYFIADSPIYPTINGGDGINHFSGGGGNYDAYPGEHSPWAPEGAQTTDTTDPHALRFGALAGTFATTPTATDWFLIGYGGAFDTGSGGTLQLVVVDTYYSNNSGEYTVTIDAITSPEPSALWLALSGIALLGLTRVVGRRRLRE